MTIHNRTTALVTGATGYIGQSLVERLVAEQWDVSAVVRPTSDLTNLKSILDDAHIHILNDQTNDINHIVSRVSPETVYHLATNSSFQVDSTNINNAIDTNLAFPIKLLQSMSENNCRYLINTGTHWQHYHSESYNPVNFYAATKEAFEKICLYYQQVCDVSCLTLKLSDVYGSNDMRGKIIHLIIDAIMNERAIDLTLGEQKIDLIHIDDVIDAYLIASNVIKDKVKIGGNSFSVSTKKNISIRGLVELIEDLTQKKLKANWGAKNYRVREIMVPWSTGEWLPGWQPEKNLTEEIKKIYELYVSQIPVLSD